MKSTCKLLEQVAAYNNTKKIAQQLKAAKRPTAFEEQHRAELTAYRAAVAYFKVNNITKLPSPNKLEAEHAQLASEKAQFYEQYNQHTAASKKTAPEELCQIDTIPPTATDTSVRKQIAERNNVSESYVTRPEKFMRGVQIMDQMIPGMQEKILSGQFKVRDADMHRLARADFPNRKQIVHEILHPEDHPAPQSRLSGINYSALEAAVRRIQQDVDFLMKYLPSTVAPRNHEVSAFIALRQNPALARWHDDIISTKAWSGTGFGVWNHRGSVEERTVEYLDDWEAKNRAWAAEREKLIREHYAGIEAAGYFDRHPEWRANLEPRTDPKESTPPGGEV